MPAQRAPRRPPPRRRPVPPAAGPRRSSARPSVLPMAVWYGGGKARAPMLEADPRAKSEAWRRDLKQIKALGFNADPLLDRLGERRACGRASTASTRSRSCSSLAEEEGLKVVVQVYMDSAPEWVGRGATRTRCSSARTARPIRPESSPGYCIDHPGVRQADLAFYEALARRAAASPAFLGFDLWSEPHVINWANPTYIDEPRVLLLPEHRGALPRVAEDEVRHARRAERGLVPALTRRGTRSSRTGSARSSRTPTTWTGSASSPTSSGGPARALRGGEARRARPRRHEPRGRRRPLLLAALLGGPVGRLDDGRAGRPLRHVLLPEALGVRGPRRRVARRAPRLRALVRLRQRRPRLLDRRAAGRLRHDRAQRLPDRHAGGPAGLELERARARGEGRLLLRVLPDEHRLRVGRLRHGPARRHGHRARRAWRARSRASSTGTRRSSSTRGRCPAQVAVVYNPLAHFVGGRQRATRLRRPAGRGRRHRARLAARHLPRALSDERAARLRARRRT